MNQKLLREVDAAGEISVVDQVPLKDKVWSEMKKMWVVAVPAIFTRASTFGINVITQAFVGHIGSTELAAYSFIYTVFLSFAIGILVRLGITLSETHEIALVYTKLGMNTMRIFKVYSSQMY